MQGKCRGRTCVQVKGMGSTYMGKAQEYVNRGKSEFSIVNPWRSVGRPTKLNEHLRAYGGWCGGPQTPPTSIDDRWFSSLAPTSIDVRHFANIDPRCHFGTKPFFVFAFVSLSLLLLAMTCRCCAGFPGVFALRGSPGAAAAALFVAIVCCYCCAGFRECLHSEVHAGAATQVAL